jgi:hypothetical protein
MIPNRDSQLSEPAGPETLSGGVEDLGPARHQFQDTMMVLNHPFAPRQWIDDWIDVTLKQPLDTLRSRFDAVVTLNSSSWRCRRLAERISRQLYRVEHA